MYHATDADKIIIYIHGGGFVTESIDTYDTVCTKLSEDTRCHVISIGYSLAPEKKFPHALMECVFAAEEISERCGIFRIKKENIIICGDSAGGNLAAALSLYARDNGLFSAAKQVLIYPVTDCRYGEDSPYRSVREKGRGYTLTSRHMRDYIELYKSSDEDLKSPYFAPVRAEDLSGLPETLLITAENDPLHDEGKLFAKRLKDAGAQVKYYDVKGASHGFFAETEKTAAIVCREKISGFINGENS